MDPHASHPQQCSGWESLGSLSCRGGAMAKAALGIFPPKGTNLVYSSEPTWAHWEDLVEAQLNLSEAFWWLFMGLFTLAMTCQGSWICSKSHWCVQSWRPGLTCLVSVEDFCKEVKPIGTCFISHLFTQRCQDEVLRYPESLKHSRKFF